MKKRRRAFLLAVTLLPVNGSKIIRLRLTGVPEGAPDGVAPGIETITRGGEEE